MTDASRERGPEHGAEAAAPEPLPALRGNAALVPVDSTEARALVAVIAILAFLAALSACAAELVAAASAQWRSRIAQEMTIQVRPVSGRDMETDVRRSAELARATRGIAEARPMPKGEAERLLEPWLGAGLDLSDIPVPHLIVLKLDPAAPIDAEALKAKLAAEVPSASLDDHALWVARLSTMARAIVGVAVAVVVLVFAATGLAVAFATRGAVAANREVVDVLHFVGADDAFIAREFQRRFFRMGLKGGAVGGALALGFIALCAFLVAGWRGSATRDQIEALFGAFDIGWQGYASVILVAAFVAGMTGVVSRMTVRHFLQNLAGRPAR
ncbi:MAG TPA: ABC transporter permease [Beijerinckiaceae bacterium]|nr:ABC transporter permease [Beijerinckiaceae bacterium]